MTQEEKAKAYDEALEKARKLLNMILDNELLGFPDQIREIFPQLRESESEDERIINLIRSLLETARNVQSNTALYKEYDDAIAWLEKQKDASKAIEAVERVDKYIDEHLANAHDMKDSNPDKKYYRGWDDALGAMAGILQDVYSGEKQKEQKPKAKAKSPLSPHELYDAKIEGISQGRQDVLDHPEQFGLQKPAEWSEEDKEKIVTISEIIEHCTTIPYSGGTLTLNKEYKKELLCFIKSLRPQYHGDVTMTEAYKMGLEAGRAQEGAEKFFDSAQSYHEGFVAGQKQKENPKSADSIPSDCTSDAKCEDRDSNYGVFPEDVIVVARACEKLETHGYPELAYALKNVNLYTKEQKPVDYDHEMWKNCEANFEGGKKEVIEHPEKYGLQKPVSISCGHENDVDWSEEDKKMLLSIINAFRNGTVSTIGQEQWLKNLPKRINPQPKPEWSEEDGEMLDSIIRVVCGVGIQPNGLREKQVSWLKSLRPSWKPSDMNTNCQGCLYWTGKCKLPKGLDCPERKEEQK